MTMVSGIGLTVFPPTDGNQEQRHEQAGDKGIIVKTILRQEERADIAHGMERTDRKNAAPSVDTDPDNQQAQANRHQAMPEDPIQRLLRLQKWNPMPDSPYQTEDKTRSQRLKAFLQGGKGIRLPTQFFPGSCDEKEQENQRHPNDGSIQGRRRLSGEVHDNERCHSDQWQQAKDWQIPDRVPNAPNIERALEQVPDAIAALYTIRQDQGSDGRIKSHQGANRQVKGHELRINPRTNQPKRGREQ